MSEIIKKEDLPQLITMFLNGMLSREQVVPYLQSYIQSYGPLDDNNELVKTFLVKFKGEE